MSAAELAGGLLDPSAPGQEGVSAWVTADIDMALMSDLLRLFLSPLEAVLAGDHQQLAACVKSTEAQQQGLDPRSDGRRA